MAVKPPLGVDDAWPTRVPPNWTTFPDGSIGPPNQPNPIDQAWPTRVPTAPGGGGLSVPRGGPPLADGAYAPPGGGDPLGQSLSARAPSPGGITLNNGGPGGPSISDWWKYIGPLAQHWWKGAGAAIPTLAAAGAAAGIPATKKWNETTDDSFLRDPNNAGGIPPWWSGDGQNAPVAAQPFTPPQHPYPMWPTPPVPVASASSPPGPPVRPPAAARAPAAAGKPKPAVDPAAVDLGYYRAGVGNARTPVYVPAGSRTAPDIFRGLLAQRPS